MMAVRWARRAPKPLESVVLVDPTWVAEMDRDGLIDELANDGYMVGSLDGVEAPRFFQPRTPGEKRLITGRTAMTIHHRLRTKQSRMAAAVLAAIGGEALQ
jgi:hypothetical protein